MVVAGAGLTFGMWWVYFTTPFGAVLVHRRQRGYLFGYGHLPLFIGIAGAGAGLHVAGLYLEHHARIGGAAVVLSPALPVGRYPLMVYLLHTLLLSAAVLLAAAGVGTAVCLLVVMIAPFVTVVGHETVGHRHQRRMLRDLGTG